MSLSTTPKRILEKRIKQRKLPSIDVPRTGDDSIDRALLGIQEHLRLYEGSTGAPKERFVSLEELEASGIVQLSVQRGFASIAGVFGEPVQRVSSTNTSTAPRFTGGGGSTQRVPRLWDDLDDVNTPTKETGSMAFFEGAEWTDTARIMRFDTATDSLILANDFSINWLTDTDSSIEFLNFDVTGGSSEILIDHHSARIDSDVTVGDDLVFSTIHTIFAVGALVSGDDYLIVAKSWYECQSGAGIDEPVDTSIHIEYGGAVIASGAYGKDFFATFPGTPGSGIELSGSRIITADGVSALTLEARTAPSPNNDTRAQYSEAWAINVTQLGLRNIRDSELVFGGSILGQTEDVWVENGSPYIIGDGVSDYVLFIDCSITCVDTHVGSAPDFIGSVRVSGGPWTDQILFAVGRNGQRTGTAYNQCGILILPAAATDTELQFSTMWHSQGNFDSDDGSISVAINIIALRLNDFTDYTIVTEPDPATPGASGETEQITGSFTSTATSGEWGFLGGKGSGFAGSGFDSQSIIRADVNSGGDTDVAGDDTVVQDGDIADWMLHSIIPIGNETTVNLGHTVDFGLFSTAPPSAGGDDLSAIGMVAFSYFATPTVATFTVGDTAYETLIDGTSVTVDSTLNVTGATDLDSTLNVDGVADFNANVEINNASLIIYDSTGSDSLTMSHDDTDFNFDFVNTADLNLNNGIVVKIWDTAGDSNLAMDHGGTDFDFTFTGTIDVRFLGATSYRFFAPFALLERTNDNADVAGWGQLWVEDRVPNSPRFTNDVGDRFSLNNVMEATYAFDTTTTDADPGAGDIRFNSATPGSVTELYISDTDDLAGDYSWILDNLAIGDLITIKSEADAADYLVASVSGSTTDGTGWWKIPVTIINSGSLPSSANQLRISIQVLSSGVLVPATSITVADEGSDTTSFPLFTTAPTGDLAPKTNTGMTFNASTADFASTLIAGIAKANLLDKAADEAITGAWTFKNAAGVVIFDAGGTDSIAFSHDGTDFNMAGTLTALLHITGITGLHVVNYSFDVDQTVGAGQDNYVLTYDDASGLIALEASAGGGGSATIAQVAARVFGGI